MILLSLAESVDVTIVVVELIFGSRYALFSGAKIDVILFFIVWHKNSSVFDFARNVRFLSKRRKHSYQNGCRNKTAASMKFFHSITRLQLTRVVGSCVYLVVPQGTTRPSGIRGCGILR